MARRAAASPPARPPAPGAADSPARPRRRRHWVAWIAVVLATLLLLVLVAAKFLLDPWTEAAIESAGTRATGVATTLGSVSVSPFTGELTFDDLELDNPEGYPSPHFLQLETGDIQVALGSLLTDHVRFPSVELKRLTLRLEDAGGTLNAAQIASHAAQQGGPKRKPRNPADQTKFTIDRLMVRNVDVHASWQGKSVHLQFAEIPLHNVGSGTTAGDLIAQLHGVLLTATLDAIVRNAGSLLPQEIAQGLGTSVVALQQLGTYTIGTIDQVGRVVSGVVEQLPAAGAGAAAAILQGGVDAARGAVEDAARKAIERLLGGLPPPPPDPKQPPPTPAQPPQQPPANQKPDKQG